MIREIKNSNIVFSAFVFFFTMFFKWESLNPTYVGWIHNGLILLFCIINYRIFKNIFNKKYKWINIFVFFWGIVVVYSAYINQNTTYDIETWNRYMQNIDITTLRAKRYDHTYYFVLKIIMFMLYFQFLNQYRKGQVFLKYLFYLLLPFVLISDINGFIYKSDGISGYEVGNKFYLCYLNIFLVTIYLLYKERNKQVNKNVIILLLVTFLLALKTKCTTMIIGTILYFLFTFILKNNKFRNRLYKPWFYLICLFVCDILFFISVTWLLQIPIIQYIIVDILGEDLTLTGRVGMYARLGEVLNECPLYGFGIGNTYLTTMMYGVGDNAQNGLLNLFIECGLLGVIFYFIMLLLMIKQASHNLSTYPIICFIYMMLVLSSIEVTFTLYFTAIMILLLLDNNSIKNQHEICRYNNSFSYA